MIYILFSRLLRSILLLLLVALGRAELLGRRTRGRRHNCYTIVFDTKIRNSNTCVGSWPKFGGSGSTEVLRCVAGSFENRFGVE